MLDHFHGDGTGGTIQLCTFFLWILIKNLHAYIEKKGFPDHPHRGFETVSYSLEGYSTHEDFAGHKGTLQEGDVQW